VPSSDRGRARTLTKAHFVERTRQVTGLSRNDCVDLVESVLAALKDTLAAGENVKLSGFGSFLVRQKAARLGRNPQTAAKITLPKRRVLVFKPATAFRLAMKDGA
jgi:integration host factor subunit alpha